MSYNKILRNTSLLIIIIWFNDINDTNSYFVIVYDEDIIVSIFNEYIFRANMIAVAMKIMLNNGPLLLQLMNSTTSKVHYISISQSVWLISHNIIPHYKCLIFTKNAMFLKFKFKYS